MNLLFIVFSLLDGGQGTVLRITYDLQIVRGTEMAGAQLALFHQSDARFSIHCRKVPAGSLFTFWARPEGDVLSFPKKNTVFLGKLTGSFRLFDEGPAMTRRAWLDLLMKGEIAAGAWEIRDDGIWRSLYRPGFATRFLWRERGRTEKKEVASRIFEPSYSDEAHVRPMAELSSFWSEP